MQHTQKLPAEIQFIMVQAMTGAAIICVIAYISMWFIFSMWSDVTHTYPTLFRVNACIFIFEALSIYQFTQYCKKAPHSRLIHKQNAVTLYVTLSGLHWGIITTYLIYSGSLSIEQQYAMRLISIGFAGIAGGLFSIANLTGLMFAVVIVAPHILASYWFQDEQAHFFTLLSCAFWLFLYFSIRSIQRNYFLQFVSNYKLTQVHADSMEYLSKKDIITKINNRFHWLINFESLWKNDFQKHQPICLIGIQVHHLSEINEAHGHHTGDAIMANIASVLQQTVADPDLLGRYSGDQFMLAITGIEYNQANHFAHQLIENIQEKLRVPNELCQPILLTTNVACTTQYTADSAQCMVESVSRHLSLA